MNVRIDTIINKQKNPHPKILKTTRKIGGDQLHVKRSSQQFI
ncbi:hypothetical protein [Metabacillus fastidiosus]